MTLFRSSARVEGRGPRVSRDPSDRAAIVSGGLRTIGDSKLISRLRACLDTPPSAALGMNGVGMDQYKFPPIIPSARPKVSCIEGPERRVAIASRGLTV